MMGWATLADLVNQEKTKNRKTITIHKIHEILNITFIIKFTNN